MKSKILFLFALLMQMPLLAQNDSVISNSSSDTVPAIDRRGHYIEAHAGLGYGSLGYKLSDPYCRTNGSFSALLQLQYAYFFHQNVGIGAGLWFTNYTGYAHLGGDFIWKNDQNGIPLYDSDNEQNYWHRAHISRWRERQTIHNVGVPISLQFQHLKAGKKAGFFAAAGIAPAFSVSHQYRVLEGEIEHSGYYPAWNLWLDNVHEFGTKDYHDVPEAKGDMKMRLQLAVFADLGALISLNRQTELFIGGYFNISATDANGSAKQDIGWQDADFTFMNGYKGAYATTLAGASHPWEAGLKIGIHWHALAREKKAKQAPRSVQEPKPVVEPKPKPVVEPQPVVEPEPVVEPKPVVKPEPKPVVEETPIVETAVVAVAKEKPVEGKPVPVFDKVFFRYDSYELTDEAQKYLLTIVPALQNDVPDYTITLEGHASDDGNSAHNKRLSYKRAEAVANFLAAQGIDAKRFCIIGYGSKFPNKENNKKFRYLNRRVEIKAKQPANKK